MPTRNALPDALIARFAADVVTLTGAPPARLLVAVSGGPDSLALLLLAHGAYPGQCFAATVDHGLRAEAAAEARMVATLCKALGVEHSTLVAPLPDRAEGSANLSARARALRYRLLGAHADAIRADAIATGHHADDQLETLVMRLNRPSGLAGLAGIPPVNGRIVRPLLGWRRAELAAIVAAAGIEAADDPSNSDDRFDRARIRKQLAATGLFDAAAVAQSMAALHDADRAIAWMVDRQVAMRVTENAGTVDYMLPDEPLPAELTRRIVAHCLARIDPGARPRGAQLSALIATLCAGGVATIGAVRCSGGATWTFTAAPPRRHG